MSTVPVPMVPVSWGELLDKITILAIKRDRIADVVALENIEREYCLLSAVAAPALGHDAVAFLLVDLRRINEALWEIEDGIRSLEACGKFGADFVALARSVYRRNDERALLKRRINHVLGSELVEEKSYASFSATAEAAARPSLELKVPH